MSITKTADYWIEKLEMIQHPEGGYFKETFRAEEKTGADQLPERYDTARCISTSIYFLLTTESVSNFHRLNSDEIWHFHTGGAARIHMISPEGEYGYKDIGASLEEGQQLQVIIPRHSWFAAEVIAEDYILVGCTVAPGFEFEDFELAQRSVLSRDHPELSSLIERFTTEPF
ncbi:MAG: cupin domain-containing protein [Roseivirga sp.]|nr:cupin domain-containing protein [Roseivirga sp.]